MGLIKAKPKRKQTAFDFTFFLPVEKKVEFLAPFAISTCAAKLEKRLDPWITSSSVIVLPQDNDTYVFMADQNIYGKLQRWDEKSTLVTLTIPVHPWMRAALRLLGCAFIFGLIGSLMTAAYNASPYLIAVIVLAGFWLLYVIERNTLGRTIYELLSDKSL